MRPLSDRGRELVDALLGDIANRPRYRTRVIANEYEGTVHLRNGSISDRAGGLLATPKDVRDLRRDLRRAGMHLSFDEVDALVSEALFRDGEGEKWYYATVTMSAKIYKNRKVYHRQKRNRRRERLREAGLCVMCGRESVDLGRASCAICVQKSYDYRKKNKTLDA